MKIESVRLKPTKQNFKDIIYALQYLDTMITGGIQGGIKLSANHILVIKTLFDNILGKMTKPTLDTYICDTFEAFRNNKKQIILHLYLLQRDANKEILDLIMYPLEKGTNKKLDNILRPEMFLIFTNIDTLIIDTVITHSISMICLLSLLDSYSVKKVIVKANGSTNWIDSLWSSDREILTTQYEMKNYDISMEKKSDSNEHWFLIN